MLISCWTHVNEMWEQRGHEVSTDGEILRLMLATNPQSNSILTRVHWSSWLVFHVPQSSSLLLWLCIHAQLWCIGVLSLKTHHNPGYKHGTLSGDINTVSVVFFKRCHCWSRWWAVLLIKVIDILICHSFLPSVPWDQQHTPSRQHPGEKRGYVAGRYWGSLVYPWFNVCS